MHISENVAEDMNDEFKENRGKYVVSDIHELKRKRDELMERLRTETESLTQQEQEIYSSAVELMLQQRDNVKTLFQVFDITFAAIVAAKEGQDRKLMILNQMKIILICKITS